MATVTGLTAARMQTMEAATVIDGNVVGNNLILVTRGGTQIDAGSVRGPAGPSGPAGSGYIICTSTTRPSLIAGDEGKAIYETDTDIVRVWTGSRWKIQEKITCTSTTRPAGLTASDEGVQIYETDTDLSRTWTGTRWKLQEYIICTSTTRPAGMGATDEGVRIYETDSNLEFLWTGAAWINAVSTNFPVGFELLWPGQLSAIPAGFLHEDGSVLLRADYPLLFAVLGTTWNQTGETATQFRLPDSRNRVAVGAGLSYNIGLYGGEATHLLTVAEMPSHTHRADGASTSIATPNNGLFMGAGNPPVGVVGNVTSTGGSAAHNIMQPYATKYVIIRAS